MCYHMELNSGPSNWRLGLQICILIDALAVDAGARHSVGASGNICVVDSVRHDREIPNG